MIAGKDLYIFLHIFRQKMNDKAIDNTMNHVLTCTHTSIRNVML